MKKYCEIIIGIGLYTVMACTETPDTRARNENQALANSTPDGEEEKVDQPNNITGSYLYCQPLLDQAEGQMVHKAGCSITDAQTGAKVPIERLAQKTDWTFRPASRSNITADIVLGQPQDAYHAIYTFRQPSGQKPNLGDGGGAVVATLSGVAGRAEPLVFTTSVEALIIEVVDSRMLDVYKSMMPQL